MLAVVGAAAGASVAAAASLEVEDLSAAEALQAVGDSERVKK
jgi:hypothetical protein